MFWQHGGSLVKLSSSYSRIAATSTSSSLNKRISPVSTLYRAFSLIIIIIIIIIITTTTEAAAAEQEEEEEEEEE